MTIPHHLCSAWVGPQRTRSANAAMSTVHARTGRSLRYGAIQRRTAVAARVGPASTAPSTVITPYRTPARPIWPRIELPINQIALTGFSPVDWVSASTT